MPYRLIILKPAQKQLDNLAPSIRLRIIPRIIALAENPRPPGCVKMAGYQDEYRIRIGDDRVRYEVIDKESLVQVLSCKHRKDAYKD